MDNWDQETIDLVQPGFIEFDEAGLGTTPAGISGRSAAACSPIG
jgi:hypothetical protein